LPSRCLATPHLAVWRLLDAEACSPFVDEERGVLKAGALPLPLPPGPPFLVLGSPGCWAGRGSSGRQGSCCYSWRTGSEPGYLLAPGSAAPGVPLPELERCASAPEGGHARRPFAGGAWEALLAEEGARTSEPDGWAVSFLLSRLLKMPAWKEAYHCRLNPTGSALTHPWEASQPALDWEVISQERP